MSTYLQCISCFSTYKSFEYGMELNAPGCASQFINNGLMCGYGSIYDNTQFNILDTVLNSLIDKAKNRPNHLICDTCITTFINDDILEEDK